MTLTRSLLRRLRAWSPGPGRAGWLAALASVFALAAPAAHANPKGCFSEPRADGPARHLLAIGVDVYRNEDVPTLRGAASDARRITETLTHASSPFGFSRGDACLLVNRQATIKGIGSAFDTLKTRVREGDEVVIFFSGHGAQAPDGNGDEGGDGLDETWVVHDSRTANGTDIVDDWLNARLRELATLSGGRVTYIADSCNSGSAARSGSGLTARNADTGIPFGQGRTWNERFTQRTGRTLDDGLTPSPGDALNLEGVVSFGATQDGTLAYEQDGQGLFTNALLETLNEHTHRPLTYRAGAQRIAARLRQRGARQIPVSEGTEARLNTVIFGERTAALPPHWMLRQVGGEWRAAGAPFAGFTQNARLIVFPATATADEVRAFTGVKALVEISELVAPAEGVIRPAAAGAPPAFSSGDIAVLRSPGSGHEPVRLLQRLSGGPAAAAVVAEALRADIASLPDLDRTVRVVDRAPTRVLAAGPAAQPGKALSLTLPDGTPLVSWSADDLADPAALARDIAERLYHFTVHDRLLEAEPGTDPVFADPSVLKVTVTSGGRPVTPSGRTYAVEPGQEVEVSVAVSDFIRGEVWVTSFGQQPDGTTYLGPPGTGKMVLSPSSLPKTPFKYVYQRGSGEPTRISFLVQQPDAASWTGLAKTPFETPGNQRSAGADQALRALGLKPDPGLAQRSRVAADRWGLHSITLVPAEE